MWGVLSAILLAFAPSYAIAEAATCVSGFSWMYNSQGQSPCDIASALLGVCDPAAGPLPQLPPGSNYTGPTVQSRNECVCSSVYFSMQSACGLCQNRTALSWTKYETNCTTVYIRLFPSPLPAGLRVPHYAYLDATATGGFDPSTAQVTRGNESVSLPSATSATVQATQSTNSTQTPEKKSQIGTIVGGVVAGIAVLGVAVGAVVWLLLHERRRAKKRRAYSALAAQSTSDFASSLKKNPQQQPYNSFPNNSSANQPLLFQQASNPQQHFTSGVRQT